MTELLVSGLVLGAVLAWALYRPVVQLLQAAGGTRPNYAGKEVPVAGGLVFVFAALLANSVQWVLAALVPGGRHLQSLLATTALTLLGFAFLGLIDDLLGSREAGGFRGHFRLLLRDGRLTSGSLKALGGALVAGWPAAAAVSAADGGPLVWAAEVFLNLVVIALAANAVNLLDLRPGRAFKGAVLLWAVGFGFARAGHPVWVVGAPLLGAAAVFAAHDLRGEVMMGDTGANPLGALAGIGAVWSWSGAAKLWLAAGLVLFHLYTERTSLTALIARVPALRWLDDLGRPAGGKDGQA